MSLSIAIQTFVNGVVSKKNQCDLEDSCQLKTMAEISISTENIYFGGEY